MQDCKEDGSKESDACMLLLVRFFAVFCQTIVTVNLRSKQSHRDALRQLSEGFEYPTSLAILTSLISN